jgi:ferric-dicitrate binding protein FerR (iron transport regulator)
MGPDVTEELLRRYLSGECSAAEEARVNAWYQSLEMEGDAGGILDLIDDEDAESRIFSRVRDRIEGYPQPAVLPGERMVKTNPLTLMLKYAAVAAFFIVVAVGIYEHYATIPGDRAEESTIAVVSNTEQSIKRVKLPDGSVLWLYPNSAVEFPQAFSEDSRSLTLRGEAFFVVSRDASRPFSINTSRVITTVLGTSFNIKAYDDEPSIEVEVMTGKVSVGLTDAAEGPVMLTSHQKATYTKGNSRVEKTGEAEEVQNDLAIWQPIDMTFDNATVGTVLQTLNEKFRVRIHVNNSNLMNCQIRADFNEQNLPDILEMLSKSVNATCTYEGNIFYLDGEGCTN